MAIKKFYEAVQNFPGIEFDESEYEDSSEMVVNLDNVSKPVERQVRTQAMKHRLTVLDDGDTLLISEEIK